MTRVGALLVVPGYSHRRDYISALAGHGVGDAWLGMLAIVAIAAAGLGAALLLLPVSRWGAAAFLGAGVGYVVVAFARVNCPNGAARCGLGGRFDVHGTQQITHWTAAVLSTVLVLVGLSLVGMQLLRRQRHLAGAATLAAAGSTLLALVATGGQTPGTVQRLWIVAMTGWLLGTAAAMLSRTGTFR